MDEFHLNYVSSSTQPRITLSSYFKGGTYIFSILGNGNFGIGAENPKALFDVARPMETGELAAVFARLSEGNTTGDGTYLGVREQQSERMAVPKVLLLNIAFMEM